MSKNGAKTRKGGALEMDRKTITGKTRETAFLGLLFAVAIALSALEGLLPPVGVLPGVKLGLSNIAVLYCVVAVNGRSAGVLAVLKAGAALFFRGPVGALLSLAGGIASVLAMVALAALPRGRVSYAGMSMAGGVCHNLGQLLAACGLLGVGRVFWHYLPVLVAAGAATGFVTSLLLRLTMPLLSQTTAGMRRGLRASEEDQSREREVV